MSTKNDQLERLTFELPRDHKTKLEALADDNDVSVAHLMRKAVRDLLGLKR